MAASVTTPAQPPRKKGLSPTTWVIIVLGGALAGGALFLYRRRNQSSSAAAATTTAPASTTDFSGQIATLQAEIADLQSSAAQDEASESGGTTTSGGSTATTLAAPGLSVTPRTGGADFGWNAVPNAKAYQLQVSGAGGAGTGTSHYDHVGTTTHASVSLTKGKYTARVRAGTSTASVTGPWSPAKSFTVGAVPIRSKGKNTPGGGGGEPED